MSAVFGEQSAGGGSYYVATTRSCSRCERNHSLRPNEPVDIEFTPAQAGEISLACGMNMLRGVLVVQ